MVDYTAYWRADPPEGVHAWANAHNLTATVGDGRPFSGMRSSVGFGELSEDQAEEVRQQFKPDMESAIPML